MQLSAAGEGFFKKEAEVEKVANFSEEIAHDESMSPNFLSSCSGCNFESAATNILDEDRSVAEEKHMNNDYKTCWSRAFSSNNEEFLRQLSINQNDFGYALGYSSIEISMCANLIIGKEDSREADNEIFEKNLIGSEELEKDPTLWYNPYVIFRFDKEGPFIPSWDKIESSTVTNGLIAENIIESVLDSAMPLKPTHVQLKQMNLKDGANVVEYIVNSQVLGVRHLIGTIYLWSDDTKIIVSDIDGTITKSDVWGQVLPILGKDWSHRGVANLFSRCSKHGYEIVYITARAIGQANTTRDYLFSLQQDEKYCLPDGPLFLSPDRLFDSFKREVIDRKSFMFKIAVLNDIKKTFPANKNPFVAGFGNKHTDYVAYKNAGIPNDKIYIIDSKGVVKHMDSGNSKTYGELAENIDEIFPSRKEFFAGDSQNKKNSEKKRLSHFRAKLKS
uniref:Phosphatidate phosphatase PAH2-like n=1 Tax=Dermatophagoides pteronyssinus TaxID=6956 RepID=A0A6P6XLI3_DERPT|nr:phosphatidate phosphatase PAH2-like [Dermatophagoides pteronyssinus]